MLALMKPSNVATRSSTRGTSCGVTVVTCTSGGGGEVCVGLREQPRNNDPQISTALTRTIRLILLLSLLAFRCRARTWRCAICLLGDRLNDKYCRLLALTPDAGRFPNALPISCAIDQHLF